MICTTRRFTGLALLLCVINVANGRHIATVRTEHITMDISPIPRIQGKVRNIFRSITTAETSPPETQSLQHSDLALPVLQPNVTRVKEYSIEDNDRLTRGNAQHKIGGVPKCNQRNEGTSTLSPEGSLTAPSPVNSHRRKKRGNVNNPQNNLRIKIKLGVRVNINNQLQSEYTLCENNPHVSKPGIPDNSSDQYISIVPASRARAKLNVEPSTPKPVENTESVHFTTRNTTETTSPGYDDTTLLEPSTKEPTTQQSVDTTLVSTTQDTTPTTHLQTELSTLIETTTHIYKRSTEVETEIGDFNLLHQPSGKKAPRSGKGTGDKKKHQFLPKAEGPTTENTAVNEKGKGDNFKSLFGCFNGTSGNGTDSGKPNICREGEIVEETIKDKSVVYVDEFRNSLKSSNKVSGSERGTEESKLRNVGPTTKVYGSEVEYVTFIAPRAKQNTLIERCYILPCINDTSKCDEMCKMLHKFKALMCC